MILGDLAGHGDRLSLELLHVGEFVGVRGKNHRGKWLLRERLVEIQTDDSVGSIHFGNGASDSGIGVDVVLCLRSFERKGAAPGVGFGLLANRMMCAQAQEE